MITTATTTTTNSYVWDPEKKDLLKRGTQSHTIAVLLCVARDVSFCLSPKKCAFCVFSDELSMVEDDDDVCWC